MNRNQATPTTGANLLTVTHTNELEDLEYLEQVLANADWNASGISISCCTCTCSCC